MDLDDLGLDVCNCLFFARLTVENGVYARLSAHVYMYLLLLVLAYFLFVFVLLYSIFFYVYN